MAKRNQVGKELYSDAEKSGRSRKELGKAVGAMPDEWDFQNISKLVASYEKAYPGRLRQMKTDLMVEKALTSQDDFGTVSKASDTRKVMWLPADLQEVMEHAYPSLWTNKKHLAWFLRKFPHFMAAERH